MSDRFLGGEIPQLPVYIGQDQRMVMASGKIDVVESDGEVTITIKAQGQDGLTLGEYLMGSGPVAVSFLPIPVAPRS